MMIKMNYVRNPLVAIATAILLVSCGESFLDVKQNQSLAIPSSIADFQALLDNSENLINGRSSHRLGFVGSDEFYVASDRWNAASNTLEKNAYVWAEEVLGMEPVSDWDYAYVRIFNTNIVLDGIKHIIPGIEEDEYNNVKGSALFLRAFSFFQVAQLFCKQYDPTTALHDPGIPLRLEPDITVKSTRSTVAQTYARILADLREAAELLPNTALIKERPSKPAAYALLARVCLQMGNFEDALTYAENSLSLSGELIDFNTLKWDNDNPANIFEGMRQSHPEVLFHSTTITVSLATYSRLTMDTSLMASYAPNDLRKKVYFVKHPTTNADLFRASYSILNSWFTGLAVDEVILIKAECLARLDRGEQASTVLNRFLSARYDRTFVPLDYDGSDNVLRRVLDERRKELVLRGVRWSDLRRLNMEDRFKTTQVRMIDGQRFTLPPGDSRYVWPLPYEVVLLSGMEQNPR